MYCTVVDWDSMDHVITQIRGQTFQTLGQVLQTLDRAFSFLLNLKKLGRVFKCSVKSSDQRTHENFLKIWTIKSSLHASNKSSELVTKLRISAFNFEIFHLV